MEFHNPIKLLAAAVSVLAFVLFICHLVRLKTNNNNKQTPPQPSGSWPIIGHLPLLGSLPHISLGILADKYGPIFMIKLGVNQALVVSSGEMAKECLSGTNDKVFVNRPRKLSIELMAYKGAMMALGPYGQYWREMRKIINVELLSNQRVEMFKDVRISEVRSAIKVLLEKCKMTESIDMKKWFHDLSTDIMVKLISGKPLTKTYQAEEYDQCEEALNEFFELIGAFVLTDALPFLRWLDVGGYEKKMKKVAKQIDRIAQRWLEEHKTRSSEERQGNQDFMDVMLGVYETGQEEPFEFDADTIVKATCMIMILAGADTTSVTLTWGLSLLLNNKEVLKKARAELDTVVGKERQVEESDLKNLVYLQAVLKETMRLYPAGPLSVPREAIADCTVSGFHIPAGTQLFVNLYKMHRDPKVWENPLDFQPERFLTTYKDYDVRGQHFELLPFGSGRRVCPGISFSLHVMQFTLANLLHGFEISTPSDETVDMTEHFGLSNVKATPLEVILTHRLPCNLYK